MTRSCLLALLLAVGMLVPGLAQQLNDPPPPPLDTGPKPRPALDTAIIAAMEKMNAAMGSVPLNGEADHDFAIAMIPHDDGAVALARFELDHGTNPQLRAIATRIVEDEAKRTAELTAWLKAHPVK